jgi:hypothetical protein
MLCQPSASSRRLSGSARSLIPRIVRAGSEWFRIAAEERCTELERQLESVRQDDEQPDPRMEVLRADFEKQLQAERLRFEQLQGELKRAKDEAAAIRQEERSQEGRAMPRTAGRARGTAAYEAAATELLNALISALVDIRFMDALPDRRLLINLIRRDVENFPDVQERAETRLHVVEIVLACMNQPDGLRALRDSLVTMAPEDAGTRRAVQLIDSATLLRLLPPDKVTMIHEVLRNADTGLDKPDWWRPPAGELMLQMPPGIESAVEAFDYFMSLPIHTDGSAAVLFLDHITGRLAAISGHRSNARAPRADSISVELREWLEQQVEAVEALGSDRLRKQQRLRPTGRP